jgi:long-chain fatty acid transport protein
MPKILVYKASQSLIISLALSISFGAQATNGLFPAGNGIVAHGMGGAGLANAGEAMSMVDNPGLISRTGNMAGFNVHVYYPELSTNITGQYVDSDIDNTITPQFAIIHSLNEELSWGIALTLLGGAGSDYPASLVGEQAGVVAGGIILSPSISYIINEESAIGLSLQYAYEEVETDGFVGGFGDNKGSTTGYGFKLGYVYDISEQTSLATTYQSKIDVGEINKHCSGSGVYTLYKLTGGDCSLDLPEIMSVGVKHQVHPNAKLLVDIQYINWEGVDIIKDVFGWENRWVYKLGGEYMLNQNIALRAGYNHSKAPQASNRVADNIFTGGIVEDHYTLGMSYDFQKQYSFSVYYSHGAENTLTQSGPVSNPGLSPISKIKMSEQVLGLGLDVQF